MIEIYNRRSELIDNLNKAIEVTKKRGLQLAEAERDYRIALAQRMMIEKEEGTKVTIIGDICRGDERIANLKFERDKYKTLYDSSSEAINVFKLQLKVTQEDIQNERRGQ